jgi:predicted dehydrogenase
MKLRVGVVGLGKHWLARHRPALLTLADRFDVRAVCDEVASRAERTAEEFGAVATDGFRALSTRDDVDAVLVLDPEWFGSLPILAACESGKAVYSATALDLQPSLAYQIKQRVEGSGVAFMAELPHRHAPATLRLKELIATTLGAPRLLYCHGRQAVDRTSNQRSGAVPHMSCTSRRDLIELVDWCRYVVGQEPSSVVGVRHQYANGEDDYEMMSLDFSRSMEQAGLGTLAQISCSRYLRSDWHEAISFRPPADLQVCCQRGVAFIDLPATLIWFDDAGRHLESLESERPVGEQMLMQFHRSVTSLVRRTDDLEDAYRSLQIVMAATKSAELGQRLSLDF